MTGRHHWMRACAVVSVMLAGAFLALADGFMHLLSTVASMPSSSGQRSGEFDPGR